MDLPVVTAIDPPDKKNSAPGGVSCFIKRDASGSRQLNNGDRRGSRLHGQNVTGVLLDLGVNLVEFFPCLFMAGFLEAGIQQTTGQDGGKDGITAIKVAVLDSL